MSAAARRKAADFWALEARKHGWVARSAYKLLELQKRYRVVREGGAVLDLGCAPGAWLQVASANGAARVVGLDLAPCDVPPGVKDKVAPPLRLDVYDADAEELRSRSPNKDGFDAVLSDLAPSTTGHALVDSAKSEALALRALELALGGAALGELGGGDGRGVLRTGGNVVVKLLEGPGADRRALEAVCRNAFSRTLFARPKATRKESTEVFLVGLGLRA